MNEAKETRSNMTTAEAARFLGVSQAAVLRWCKEGRIPGARRLGGWWRIPRVVVERIEQDGTAEVSA